MDRGVRGNLSYDKTKVLRLWLILKIWEIINYHLIIHYVTIKITISLHVWKLNVKSFWKCLLANVNALNIKCYQKENRLIEFTTKKFHMNFIEMWSSLHNIFSI